MNTTEFDKFFDAAKIAAHVTPGTPELMLLPYFDAQTMTASLMSACVIPVGDNNLDPGAATNHTAVFGYREVDGVPDWVILCSEKFLEGRDLSLSDAEDRAKAAVDSVSAANPAALVKTLLKSYSTRARSDSRCQFFLNFRRKKELCDHTNAALAFARDNLKEVRNGLVDLYNSALSGSGSAAQVGDTMSLEDLAFRTPILIEGDRGSGKTTDARALARKNGYWLVEQGGHESVESAELLGYLVSTDEPGKLVWKDGPISEAVRRAQTEKVVLLIDELLRIPVRQLSILLNFLSPDQGRYWLRTGRVASIQDGVATEERLSCPVENLCVIATTNVGAAYAVDDMDAAIAERFTPLRQDTELNKLKGILESTAQRLGNSSKAVDLLLKFFRNMEDLKRIGMVANAPTTRTLVRALELSGGSDEGVQRALRTLIPLWVNRDMEGRAVPEQVATVKETIEDAASGKGTKTKKKT